MFSEENFQVFEILGKKPNQGAVLHKHTVHPSSPFKPKTQPHYPSCPCSLTCTCCRLGSCMYPYTPYGILVARGSLWLIQLAIAFKFHVVGFQGQVRPPLPDPGAG
jgi:hypothetical protein